MEADRALQMAHAVIVLICGIIRADLIETMAASKFLDLFFLHAVAAHALLALNAEVHFVTDK